MRRLPWILIVAAAAVCAATMAAIASGALTFLAGDSSVSPDVYPAILTWWVVFSLAVLLVTAAVRRPAELALAFVSVLVVLVLAEVALRVSGTDRAQRPYAGLKSSRFHHVNAPDAEMLMGIYDGHPVVIRTNEDGMRTRYSREEFLRYPQRVLIMGDSFVWGLGVRQDRMVASVVERRLRAALGTDSVAVIPGANISYSPLLLRQRYREVYRRYRPTVVLLVVDVSDIGDDTMYLEESLPGDTLRWDLPDERPAPFFSAVYQTARPFLAWVGRQLMYPYYTFIHHGPPSYDYYDFQVEVDGVVERNRFFIYRHPLASTRPYFDRTRDFIDDIARDVAADGAEFAVMVAPRYHHWSDRECPGNWEVRQYQYTVNDPYEFAYFDYFDEMARERSYPVVSLLPVFERSDRFPLVFATDPHWNDAGHDVVGEYLAGFLLERDWVTRP